MQLYRIREKFKGSKKNCLDWRRKKSEKVLCLKVCLQVYSFDWKEENKKKVKLQRLKKIPITSPTYYHFRIGRPSVVKVE